VKTAGGCALSLLDRRLSAAFERRVVAVAPGGSRVYDAVEWHDALVVVECGEVELECRGGGSERFRRGDVLWLSGLPLSALHNRGDRCVVLVAVSRRPDRRRP
jgi:hypothetical protein